MVHYESVPRDETNIRESASTPLENDRRVDKMKTIAQVYVQVPGNDDDQSRQPAQQKNRPCMYTCALAGLALCFAICSSTVGLLYHFSKTKDGLTTERDSRRYLWIYGPTAVIVVIRVVWRVIDLKVKQSMPWHVLVHGPATADQSILLEYMSHTIFGNAWRSIKHRHCAVTMTILGNLICLLMIVFATGLFALEPTLVSQEHVRFSRNQFNASLYNSSAVGAAAALLSFAINGQNLTYPQGTTADTLVPLFEPVELRPKDSAYEAQVEGLHVSFACDVLGITNATRKMLPWWSLRAPYFLSNVTAPGCELLNVPVAMGPTGMVWTRNNTQAYSAYIDQYVCNRAMDYSTPQSRGQLVYGMNDTDLIEYRNNLNRTFDSRIFISIVDFRFPPNEGSEIPEIWIHNLTTMLCKPTYTINEYRVGYHQNMTRPSIDFISQTSNTLPHLYSGDISRGVDTAFNDYKGMYLGMGGSDFVLSAAIPPFFQIIESIHGGEKRNFSMKNLLDPEILKSSAESLLTSTAIQLLHKNIMTEISSAAEDSITGTLRYVQERLHVKAISTGFLCTCFTVMASLSLMLIFLMPRQTRTTQAVGSILAVVNTLKNSPGLVESIRKSPHRGIRSTLQCLQYVGYKSSSTDAIAIESSKPATSSISKSATEHHEASSGSWWYPASARVWFTVVAVVLCLTTIGFLEGLQHLSDSHHGFVGVRSIDLGTTVLAQYVPAAVALGIVLVFGSIELLVATATPFSVLRKGNAPGSRALTTDYLTRSGPHLFIRALIDRNIALSVILSTTFVASFLSIVISGLYTHITVPSISEVIVLQADKFDPTGVDISFDDKYAGTMLNLLTYYDIDYSNWVFDDLAFPQLSMPSIATELQDASNTSSSTVSLRTEAIRAELQCEPVQTRSPWVVMPMNIPTYARGDSDWISVSSIMEIPWSLCSNPPVNASKTAVIPWYVCIPLLTLQQAIIVLIGVSKRNQTFLASNSSAPGDQFYVGKADILKWDKALEKSFKYKIAAGGDGSKDAREYGLNPEPLKLPDWGCPSLAFTLGAMTFQSDPRNITYTIPYNFGPKNNTWVWESMIVDANVTTVVCWQKVQSVETNITLNYPDLSISPTNPPRPDERAVQWLKNTTTTTTGMTFDFVPNSMLLSLNNPNGWLSAPWKQSDDADRFSQALIHIAQKEYNLTMQDLIGSDKLATFQKVVQKLYGRYMAQAFSSNMRVDVNKETPNMTLVDTPWIPPSLNATSNYTSFLRARTLPMSAFPSRSLHRRDNTQLPIPAVLTQIGTSAHIRMVQNKGPKIALQVMLGFMAAGAIVTRILLRTNELFPHEPYSIAGRAILVANGNILQHDLTGEEQDDKEQRYRLGWWKDRNGAERYGICVQE